MSRPPTNKNYKNIWLQSNTSYFGGITSLF